MSDGIAKLLYNANPVHIWQGKSQGCGRKHDKTTKAEVLTYKIGKFFSSKPDHGPIKPSTHRQRPMKPLQSLPGKVEYETTMKHILPQVSEKQDPKEFQVYNNFVNNHEGFSFDKNEKGEYKMDVKGKQLPEALSTAAFNLMHNDKTSIELGNKDFGKMFADMHPAGEQADKPMTEKDFMNFHETYVKNAQGTLGRNDKDLREKEQTVDMDNFDKDHLSNFFQTMAGKDNLLTKQEYVDFNKNMFEKFASGKNGQDTKLTRAEQDKFIFEWDEK